MKKKESLIKNKKRVRQHGEVFTPAKIVNDMLDLEGLKEKTENIRCMVLEPSVGEGIFLVEILDRRLKNLLNSEINIQEFENQALLSISTLYGIELLEDNAYRCVINLYMCFYKHYNYFMEIKKRKVKKKILDSAKTIISANIVQGNFLTKLSIDGKPIVFSEWKEIENNKSKKNIRIIRTEYSLDEIYNNEKKIQGIIFDNKEKSNKYQISLFDLDESILSKSAEIEKSFRYIECNLSDVYKEEMEEHE